MGASDIEREVIASLDRAADTIRRMSFPRNGAPPRVMSYWPDVVRNAMEAYGWEPDRPRLSRPSPEAIDDLDRVLPWLFPLDPTQRKIVWTRAMGFSWQRIAEVMGVNAGQVRYAHEKAIDRIVSLLAKNISQVSQVSDTFSRKCRALRPK